MKRLIKKSSNQKLYHGTDYESLLKIVNSGFIIPQGNNSRTMNEVTVNWSEDDFNLYGEDFAKENYLGYVFLSATPELAKDYAQGNGDIAIVLECEISDDTLLPDDSDCPSCKTWQESLNVSSQVKVSGEISTSDIKKVFFYDDVSYTKIGESNLQSWEQEYNSCLEYIQQF